MRVAGRIAAGALAEAGKAVRPGVTTDEIDRVAHEYMIDHGAYPSTLGYKGFPKSCCTSLNEMICHGIPDSTVIEDGDIVNIDVTAYIDGVHGDTNATFLAGDVSEEHRLLVERTHEATMRAIKAVKPGSGAQRSSAVSSRRTQSGSVTAWFATSPATASAPHSTPGWWCCTTTSRRVQTVIEQGMTFTIEPMITLGDDRLRDVGRRLDRRHQGQDVDGPVRAHPGGHRHRRGDSHCALRPSAVGSLKG